MIEMKASDQWYAAAFEFLRLMFEDKKKERIKIDDYTYECNQG